MGLLGHPVGWARPACRLLRPWLSGPLLQRGDGPARHRLSLRVGFLSTARPAVLGSGDRAAQGSSRPGPPLQLLSASSGLPAVPLGGTGGLSLVWPGSNVHTPLSPGFGSRRCSRLSFAPGPGDSRFRLALALAVVTGTIRRALPSALCPLPSGGWDPGGSCAPDRWTRRGARPRRPGEGRAGPAAPQARPETPAPRRKQSSDTWLGGQSHRADQRFSTRGGHCWRHRAPSRGAGGRDATEPPATPARAPLPGGLCPRVRTVRLRSPGLALMRAMRLQTGLWRK